MQNHHARCSVVETLVFVLLIAGFVSRLGRKMAGRTKGTKTFTPKQREEIKYIIVARLKYRGTNNQLLERLEDGGFNMSIPTLITFKNEIREHIGDRYKEIAEIEMAEEHDFAIQSMKDLLREQFEHIENDKFLTIEGEPDTDRRNHVIDSILRCLSRPTGPWERGSPRSSEKCGLGFLAY